MKRWLALAGMLLCLETAHANAQAVAAPTPEPQARCDRLAAGRERDFCVNGYGAPALAFPAAAEEGAHGELERMAIFKPPGNGPFPAIVLLHTCAALGSNPQIPYWVRQALARGYAAFVVDSFRPRGFFGNAGCGGIPNAVPMRVRDAFAAAAHLARFAFVDATRIAAQGFSQGARVSYLLASRGVGNIFAQGVRFAAVVTTYGQCFSPTTKTPFVRDDMTTPLLALLGEKDDDGNPKVCLPLLEHARAAGAPVEWKVFPGVGHVWDQPNRVPGRRMPFNEPPGSVLYQYDAAVTEQSRDLAFDFLARVMPGRAR
jgi:dienelactone hydrolase